MLIRTLCLLFLVSLFYACKPVEAVSRTEPSSEFQKQINYHNRSLRLDPTHGPTYRERGILYYENGDYEQALSDFNRALAWKDSSCLSFYHRGLSLLKLNRPAEARQSFEKGWRENPYHAPTLAYIGFYQLQDGYPQAALQSFDTALAGDSSLLIAHLNRGSAHYQLGHLEAAIRDFRWVTEHEPFHSIALSNLGLALCEAKRCEEGIPYLDQALSVAPNLAEAWYNRGLARYAQGELGAAMEDFRQAKSLKPELVIRLNGKVWEP